VIENVDKKTQATAMAWSLMGTFSSQGISFVVSIFLARLLTPEDFGLVGMSLVFVNLLQMIVDAGFTTALIQRKENSQEVYDAVFSFNLLVAIVLMLIFWSAAPAIGRFYNEPLVESLVFWLSMTLPLSALSLVQRGILERHLRFKDLGVRSVVAGVISGIFGVALALLGYGVYALVVQVLSASLVSALVLWYVSEWRPKTDKLPSWKPLSELFTFSKFVFLGTVLNRTMTEGSALVIGKMFSPATLGFYTRANSLNTQINCYAATTITKVYLPVLSKIESQQARFEEVLLNVIRNSTMFICLLAGIFMLFGEVLILGVFGEQWGPAVPIFQIIMLKSFVYPINSLIVNAILAKGEAKSNFYMSVIKNAIRIIPFVIAFFYGFEPFLYSIVAVSVLGIFINMAGLHVVGGIDFWRQIKIVGLQFLIFLFSLGVSAYVVSYSPIFSPESDALIVDVISSTLSVILFVVLYICVSILAVKGMKTTVRDGLNKVMRFISVRALPSKR
jgi:O-antigen/teichoic acid export membrane protein